MAHLGHKALWLYRQTHLCYMAIIKQKILLNCEQSNVPLAHIIFFCMLLRAFSFLSACIRAPASNWDPFNIILIVTGNCLTKFIKYCLILGNESKKFPILVDDTSCHLSCYTSMHASIWHRWIWRLKNNGVTTLTFLGSRDVIGHVTIRLTGVDFLRVVHSDHAAI